jgi:predicted ATPase/class 3 adenylate cyclase
MKHDTTLPQGTVTFLFTDIEGSTRLLQHLGDRYADLLADHRRLLRAAFQPWSAHELSAEGDALFVAFARAADALAASAAAQQALAHHSWPEGARVRVRMGVHTGEPSLTPEGYVGLDVHRGARLRDAAHGGQILLSQATRDAIVGEWPPGVTVRDLGTHRLKDLQRPEQIFQLLHPALPADFPPIRSLEAYRHNLPVQVTSFVGREREIEEVKRLLEGTHLLTLTGAGGSGKTRLAVQVAAGVVEEYAHGVRLVELASLTDPGFVPQAVATALGVREEPGRALDETLVEFLRARSLLLVLDNCEHLVEASARLAQALLRSGPNLRLLATSREALNIAGETRYRLPPLTLPGPGAGSRVEVRGSMAGSNQSDAQPSAILQYEAARLFAERAAAVLPTFALTSRNASRVVHICRRLDGMPLAIELAAARVRMLPVEQIARHLDDRFRLLTGGSRTALPRQQTLRAAIDWSYDLLPEAEQRLLCQLSVFAGGFTLKAAEAVCSRVQESAATPDPCPPITPPEHLNPRTPDHPSPDEVFVLLTQLVDKSLVIAEEQDGETRFRLLETIRHYSREKLRASEEQQAAASPLAERHARHYLEFAEERISSMRTRDEARALDELAVELDNLRAGMDWAKESHQGALCARLALALHEFLYRWGAWQEAWSRLCDGWRAIAEPSGDLQRLRAAIGHNLARLALDRGDLQRLRAAIGHNLARLALDRGDLAEAREQVEATLALQRELNDTQGIPDALNLFGLLVRDEGDLAGAQRCFEDALGLLANSDHVRRGTVLHNLAVLTARRGDVAEARRLYQESLTHQQIAGDRRAEVTTLSNLGTLAHQFDGDYATARRLYRESLALWRMLRDRHGIAVMLNNLGELAELDGDAATAIRFFVHAEILLRDLQSADVAFPSASLRRLAEQLGGERYEALRAAAEQATWEEVVEQTAAVTSHRS